MCWSASKLSAASGERQLVGCLGRHIVLDPNLQLVASDQLESGKAIVGCGIAQDLMCRDWVSHDGRCSFFGDSTSVNQLRFASAAFLCRSSQDSQTTIDAVFFHRFGSSKEGRDGGRGDQVVATSMPDLRQSIVLRTNDDETSTRTNLGLEAGLKAVRMFLHTETARGKVGRYRLVSEMFLVRGFWVRVELLVDGMELIVRRVDCSSDCVTPFVHTQTALLAGGYFGSCVVLDNWGNSIHCRICDTFLQMHCD